MGHGFSLSYLNRNELKEFDWKTGPGMDLDPSLTKVGSDVVLIFQRYKQLSLKVCSVVIGTLLLLVLHLIEKSHNANHNNRCKIITTNEIFIVYICLEAISYISLQCEFESRQHWKMTK